jgi:lipopolysaccharide biosynthesis regulator YciM
MKRLIILCAGLAAAAAAAEPPVRSYEGSLTIPTYEPRARELEPALFSSSTVSGMYPFPTYLLPWREGSPAPKTYHAVFLENEYLKLTYLPELGGRIFSLFDKLRNREVFYRNDVIKPAPYNPRMSWPQSGLELTGPHDVHTLTLHGEPFWSHRVVPREGGALSLVLGETDPVYQMEVTLTATLHPGVAALELGIFCYNSRDAHMPQMFWVNTAVPATPKTRFLYQMSRTVGHTTADIADWPVYNGIDYSWDRNNKNMLGVFGIDEYDDFNGAYQFDHDYGVFRYADRRIVQGMKMWTFGYGPGAKGHERSYTDNAGPYVELQSGRHVWDGHYEWVAPHKTESWSEWWVPVAGITGVTKLTKDVALNLEVTNGAVKIGIAATRRIPRAKLEITARGGGIARTELDLVPATTFHQEFPAKNNDLTDLRVLLTDSSHRVLLDYRRPASSPGRKEYTPFTKPLESPRKSPEQMSVEELVLAAESHLKELDSAGAASLLNKALERDAGFSRAHLLLGVQAFSAGKYEDAVRSLEKAIARDPYADEACYYLAMSQFALGRDGEGERNLYYIWPHSSYYGAREYQLARLNLRAGDRAAAIERLRGAIEADARDLLSRLTLALVYRELGRAAEAREQLATVEKIDPNHRIVFAERFFASGSKAAKRELLRMMGGQSQEAISVSNFYRQLNRWDEAVRLLRLLESNNQDPWGTPPEFYYTLAYCHKRAGDAAGAEESWKKARAAAGTIDRFPYREETEPVLREAVAAHPDDAQARYLLGCLLHYRNSRPQAIEQWEAAVQANPSDFSTRRALGLAYAEQGFPVERAATQLERALQLQPGNLRTVNDLSSLYARAGRFGEQLSRLKAALARSPADDDLAEGLLSAQLSEGNYADAESLLAGHQFGPHHRSYGLRNKYRLMRYGQAARAGRSGDWEAALRRIREAGAPPASLGVDDFQGQNSPRLEYYAGLVLEKLGRSAEARQSFERAVAGVPQLSGDRDSWNSENFFIVPALEKLGRSAEAVRLKQRFENFAASERDSGNGDYKAEARYLLALARKQDGRPDEAKALIAEALAARPDLLPARLELRGDVIDPLPK